MGPWASNIGPSHLPPIYEYPRVGSVQEQSVPCILNNPVQALVKILASHRTTRNDHPSMGEDSFQLKTFLDLFFGHATWYIRFVEKYQ